MTKTYTLTMTPPDGEHTVHHGLTREQALTALNGLMYGDDVAAPAEQDDQPEHLAA